MPPIENILILFVLILLSAFFSAAESALTSIHYVKVKTLLKKGKPGSKILYALKKKPQAMIITILIGNNIVNILASGLSAIIFLEWFGSKGLALSAGVMIFLILTFGEIVPKTLALQNSQKFALFSATPIYYLSFIFYPIIKFYHILIRLINKIVKHKVEKKISEEELKVILSLSKDEGILSKEASKIMQKIVDFEDTKVKRVMTRKENMKIIDGDLSIKKATKIITKKGYSRFPVYLYEENNIVGVVDVDDVLKNIDSDQKIKDILRPVEFISQDREIGDILYDFEDKSVLMAIVVDGSGEVIGLVTVEDILEEILGNIFDKSNRMKH